MPERVVLQIITGLDYGGAEKVVFDLCTGLQNKGHRIILVGLSQKKAMMQEFLGNDVDVLSLGMKRNPGSFFKSIIFLNRLIRREKVNIMHVHMTDAMVVGATLKLFNWKLPLVFTPHNYRFGSRIRKGLISLLKIFRTRDILFSPEHYDPIFKKEFVIIPNGISLDEPKKKMEKEDIFTFISVGRLQEMKNHQALIPIAKQLAENYPFKIRIVGEGPLKDNLQKRIDEEKLGKVVELMGFRRDIVDLCRKSHVFVLPSLWEGLPIVLLEAGLAKLPVISTPVGSIPALIDSETGFVGSLGDFPEFMAYCMENYDNAVEKGLRLHERIKKDFSKERFIEKHILLYQDLTQGS